jgi:hypothetical protein
MIIATCLAGLEYDAAFLVSSSLHVAIRLHIEVDICSSEILEITLVHSSS